MSLPGEGVHRYCTRLVPLACPPPSIGGQGKHRAGHLVVLELHSRQQPAQDTTEAGTTRSCGMVGIAEGRLLQPVSP